MSSMEALLDDRTISLSHMSHVICLHEGNDEDIYYSHDAERTPLETNNMTMKLHCAQDPSKFPINTTQRAIWMDN